MTSHPQPLPQGALLLEPNTPSLPELAFVGYFVATLRTVANTALIYQAWGQKQGRESLWPSRRRATGDPIFIDEEIKAGQIKARPCVHGPVRSNSSVVALEPKLPAMLLCG